jgi:hypothetical protein
MISFMEAIARQEGFNLPGSRPQRRNNPGDIEEGKFAQTHGALPSDGNRFAAWPTPEAGFAAMRTLLTSRYLGLTVEQALNKWAPPTENNVNAYLKNVSSWCGLQSADILTTENIG